LPAGSRRVCAAAGLRLAAVADVIAMPMVN
jgi:hypothetical protein